MKIAIVTPTCRENPRSVEASRTLAASLACAPEAVELVWIIVDEKGRKLEDLIDCDAMKVLGDRAKVDVIPPLPSKHRVESANKAPAHNSARSAGLISAIGRGADYVVFLNDCNVVTYGTISVIADCAKQGLGYRARMHEVADMSIPPDGKIAYKDHHDLLRPIPTKTACGALWGAPMQKFEEIRGFDLSYDGERYGNDLDAIIRLSRVGVTFVTTERAFVIQLRRTKTSQEITTRKDVLKGERNRALINQLMRDTKRIHPLWTAGDPEPLPVEVVADEPAPVDDTPKPKWKKRAPPIVGGRRPQSPAEPPKAVQRRPAPVVGAQRLPRQNQVAPPKPRPAPPAPPRVVSNAASGPAPLPPPPDVKPPEQPAKGSDPEITVVAGVPIAPIAPVAPPGTPGDHVVEPETNGERVATDDELADFLDEGDGQP